MTSVEPTFRSRIPLSWTTAGLNSESVWALCCIQGSSHIIWGGKCAVGEVKEGKRFPPKNDYFGGVGCMNSQLEVHMNCKLACPTISINYVKAMIWKNKYSWTVSDWNIFHNVVIISFIFNFLSSSCLTPDDRPKCGSNVSWRSVMGIVQVEIVSYQQKCLNYPLFFIFFWCFLIKNKIHVLIIISFLFSFHRFRILFSFPHVWKWSFVVLEWVLHCSPSLPQAVLGESSTHCYWLRQSLLCPKFYSCISRISGFT